MAFTLPDEVIDWVAATTGGTVVMSDRKPGGARKEAWFVDIQLPDGTIDELFLRFDRSDTDPLDDPWTLQREAQVYVALQGTEVPVPTVHAVHPTLQAMLSERIVAENWFNRITEEAERVSTARHFMECLAALHRIDPASLDLPGFPEPTSVADMVRYELAEWETILSTRGGEVDPMLRFSMDWLARNIPDYDGPVVLVQGDTGPGNFLYENGRVLAVVDWELAHLGDPMDDIAWLALRATQEELPDFPALLAEYAELSGNAIDAKRVHYYEVMAEAKLQVMRHRPPAADDEESKQGTADAGNGLIYGTLHRRLWLEALGAALEVEAPTIDLGDSAQRSPNAWLYDAILGDLKDVIVPRIDDPLAKQRAKGLARIIKYLGQIDELGPRFDADELRELTELLGAEPASLSEARRQLVAEVRAGSISDEAYLKALWRRALRDTEVMRPSMGVLANRHWPQLTSKEDS